MPGLSAYWSRQRVMRRAVVLLAVSLALAACSAGQIPNASNPAGTAAAQTVTSFLQSRTPLVTSTRELSPTPTLAPPTVTASLSPSPTRTIVPSPTPSPIPSLDTSVTPDILPKAPLADVRFISPGQLSKVISTFQVEASAIPGPDGRVRIELIGEDGRVLTRQVLAFAVPHGQRVGFAPRIHFEIPGVAETARLQISVTDGYDRVTALSSVNIILLSAGEAQINPAGDQKAPFFLVQPYTSQVIQGGSLQVDGFARVSAEQVLNLDLLTSQGQVLASRQVRVTPGGDGSYQPFSTNIPYQLKQPAWVLLVIRQAGDRIPGDTALTSLLVYLKP